MAVLPIPCKGSPHPRVVPAEGNMSPHLHLSKHEVFAATMSEDEFEHDTACQMEQGRCNVGCLLPPWHNNFRQRAGSSRGSMSTAVTVVWAAAERHSATSCLGPVPFLTGICVRAAAPASRTGAGRELLSPFCWARPLCGSACSPPGTGESEPTFGNPQPQPLSSTHLACRIHGAPGAGASSPDCQW